MSSVIILGQQKPVEFIDADPTRPLDREILLAGLEEVASLIAATTWTEEQRDAFDGMLRIVFFEGAAAVNGYELSRPGCDEKEATFYWEAVEFLANPDPRVRANTFFHDCWHVVQYKANGYANGDPERVAREVDAINRQIEVAERLQCRGEDIEYLRRFEDDQNRIQIRLAEGIEAVSHA